MKKVLYSRMVRLGSLLAALLPHFPSAGAQDLVRGHLLTVNNNGAWCWYQDDRVIVDPFTNKILVGSCADGSGCGGGARDGDIEVAALDLSRGKIGAYQLHNRLQGDDHDSPALLLRPDGRYLAMFARHNSDRLSRWRVSLLPGDPTQWSAPRTISNPAAVTYSNLHFLREDRSGLGRTYNIVRSLNFDPNLMVSNDYGSTWSLSGKLLTEGGRGDRPYLKYVSDGRRRIHLITTERHPRNYDNSIYHGYVEGGRLYDSLGRVVDPNVFDSSGKPPAALTPVFKTGTVFGGVTMRRAWTIDLALDSAGRPRALYQARAKDLSSDHRLFYAYFDGRAWHSRRVCRLGPGLYPREADYTGLASLHPDDETTIFVSTPIDPRTNASLPHHEIFKAETADKGRTWKFTPVTERSTVDNLRPVVARWQSGRTALFWFRGTYRSYTSYDTAVVGLVDASELSFRKIVYVDGTLKNTTLASGGTFKPTGPGPYKGAADGKWHLRTGFGNGGMVFTSDESGSEDVPMLRTRLTGLGAGRYDVFLFFWSNPAESWRIRAGLSRNELRTYPKHAAEAAQASDFSSPGVVLAGPTVAIYKVWLGRAHVDKTGRLDIFVDDLATGQTSWRRTWYDGVGVAPAPCRAYLQEAGHSCGGAPRLSAAGTPQLGKSFSLTLTGGAPSAPAALIAGFGDMKPMGLQGLGYPTCLVYPVPSIVLGLGVLSGQGVSNPMWFNLPNDPSLCCFRVNFQGLVAAPSSYLQLTPAKTAHLGR